MASTDARNEHLNIKIWWQLDILCNLTTTFPEYFGHLLQNRFNQVFCDESSRIGSVTSGLSVGTNRCSDVKRRPYFCFPQGVSTPTLALSTRSVSTGRRRVTVLSRSRSSRYAVTMFAHLEAAGHTPANVHTSSSSPRPTHTLDVRDHSSTISFHTFRFSWPMC